MRSTWWKWRRAVAALAVGGAISLSPMPAASAAPTSDGVAPDLGVYCNLLRPEDPASQWWNASPPYLSTHDRPVCVYNRWFVGEERMGRGIFPAFLIPGWKVFGDWGAACRVNYGPQSWAQRVPGPVGNGRVTCQDVDWDFHMQAQADAIANWPY